MAHYFSENNDTLKSNPQVIAFSVNNTPLKFSTDNGVFSKKGLDRGTEVLLKYLEVGPSVFNALDLGCGYGVVGIYLN
ncbi:MAG: methyltransferase, partial [Bacilli bacterium]|nr:methyltransferase [Bacilli bacterium]